MWGLQEEFRNHMSLAALILQGNLQTVLLLLQLVLKEYVLWQINQVHLLNFDLICAKYSKPVYQKKLFFVVFSNDVRHMNITYFSFLIDVARLILLFLLMSYPMTGHLSQRPKWNDLNCSLAMVLRNRSCMLFSHLKKF